MSIQQEVAAYWEGEAELYSQGIMKELHGFQRQAWLTLIQEHAPEGERLQVLDIGCGPGFFSVILSEAGHLVTGIDCTDNMLAEAQGHADREGVSVTFRKMDSHQLEFADHSFHLIVCRNVTWSLANPEAAYKEWKRVLKPGGRLLIFDANWNRHLADEEMKALYEQDHKAYEEQGFGEPPRHVDWEESDRLSLLLPLTHVVRPAWDEQVLQREGFSKVYSVENLSSRVMDEQERVLTRSTPVFVVVAEK